MTKKTTKKTPKTPRQEKVAPVVAPVAPPETVPVAAPLGELIGPGDPMMLAEEPTPARCPNCATELPAVPVTAQLVICPACLRSVVLDDPPRLAIAEDTVNLSVTALAALRGARKKARLHPPA